VLHVGKNTYTINGVEKTMDVSATIINSRTMVPIRVISEAFGYSVQWDDSQKKVTITGLGHSIELFNGKPTAYVDGAPMEITLLYRRAPNSEFMKKLYEEYEGVSVEPVNPEEKCIMCRLCVKACEKVGAFAISTIMRGTEKRVATPFDEASPTCIGCSACADICPTGAIIVKKENGKQEIWHKTFEMSRCENCGEYFSTLPVKEHVVEQLDVEVSGENLCPKCRRKKLASEIAEVSVNR